MSELFSWLAGFCVGGLTLGIVGFFTGVVAGVVGTKAHFEKQYQPKAEA